MKDYFNGLIHEKFKTFAWGGIGGFITGFNLLFIGDPVRSNIGFWSFLLKLLATFALSLATGLGAAVSADLWKGYKKKQRIKKLNNAKKELQKRA